MPQQITALDKAIHQKIKIDTAKVYENFQHQNLVSIQAHEFLASSTNYPIAFVKNNETGEFIATAMLGLQPSENLFYRNNQWDTSYIPNAIQLYPFSVHKNANNDPILCIDMNSTAIGQETGDLLFDNAGQQTNFLNQIMNKLSDYMAQSLTTREFISHLVEKQLISPFSLTIQDKNAPQGSYSLKGIYIVDQKKLQALSDQDFLELRTKHYLPLIYAHLMSLNIVERMASKKLPTNTFL